MSEHNQKMRQLSYVDGLLFDPTLSKVVLIRKHKPAWQLNLLNCVGGKIEDGETPEAAMEREFREETGVTVTSWRRFLDMQLLRDHALLVCFFAIGNVHQVSSFTEEPVGVYEVDKVMNYCDTLPNVRWLIQMARSFPFGESSRNFVLREQ